MNIEEFDRISNKFGGFTFSELYQDDSRKYSFISFDCEEKEFQHLDGYINPELTAFFTSNFPFTNSISAAYAKIDDEKINDDPIDLYFLNSSILEEDYETEMYELLIFHEIVHQIEKNSLGEILNIELEEQDLTIGNKINEIAQKMAHFFGAFSDRDHNENFGALLNYFFRVSYPERRRELLGKAMIKNFLDDYSEEFI